MRLCAGCRSSGWGVLIKVVYSASCTVEIKSNSLLFDFDFAMVYGSFASLRLQS